MFELVIGSKNYSSWSLRPWFLMRAFDVPFEERLIPLRLENTKAQILAHSPSGLVPALKRADKFAITDSLAICEHLADLYPEKALWPENLEARAFGRMMSAEMHSGFVALRRELPMDFVHTYENTPLIPEVQADIDRILTLWSEARERFGMDGPYLLGALSIADAMYAPVVSRFKTYGVDVPQGLADYMGVLWEHPALQEWYQGALAEGAPPTSR